MSLRRKNSYYAQRSIKRLLRNFKIISIWNNKKKMNKKKITNKMKRKNKLKEILMMMMK